MAFTYFFRDLHVLELAVHHAGPVLMGRSRPGIWDAGCAMGPEPYSLAMILAEQVGTFTFSNLRILATDIDESGQFGRVISEGVYSSQDVERIPPEYLERYFESGDESGSRRVVARIRDRVRFERHDLLSLKPAAEDLSLIVCKNVLLHFTPAQREQVIAMFHTALAPGGFFVTEQTQAMPARMAPCFERVVADGQLYRKPLASTLEAAARLS
jgi:chemotaxis protein methyltransferase CheR